MRSSKTLNDEVEFKDGDSYHDYVSMQIDYKEDQNYSRKSVRSGKKKRF